jgi:hypothetical protein
VVGVSIGCQCSLPLFDKVWLLTPAAVLRLLCLEEASLASMYLLPCRFKQFHRINVVTEVS